MFALVRRSWSGPSLQYRYGQFLGRNHLKWISRSCRGYGNANENDWKKTNKNKRKKGKDLEIYHGEECVERKSRFMAHVARVHSQEDVETFMSELLKDEDIAQATHNILAYRIELDDGQMDEQRKDDGETGAGENLLILLKRSDMKNVAVCVTRWYGGVHLGPDRFRMITNVTKDLLQELGWIPSKGNKSKK